jgi:hypothetical protein
MKGATCFERHEFMKNRVDCELKKNPHESETETLPRVAARKRSASISVHALAKEYTSLAGIQDGGPVRANGRHQTGHCIT